MPGRGPASDLQNCCAERTYQRRVHVMAGAATRSGPALTRRTWPRQLCSERPDCGSPLIIAGLVLDVIAFRCRLVGAAAGRGDASLRALPVART